MSDEMVFSMWLGLTLAALVLWFVWPQSKPRVESIAIWVSHEDGAPELITLKMGRPRYFPSGGYLVASANMDEPAPRPVTIRVYDAQGRQIEPEPFVTRDSDQTIH